MLETIHKFPMSLGEILKHSINFIFKNISWILPIGFIFVLGEQALTHWAISSEISDPSSMLYPLALTILSVGIIIWLLTFIGMVTALFAEQILGHNMSWQEGFKKGFKKTLPLIGLMLLIIPAIVLGFILLIVPGFIVSCALACAVPAMILEDLGPVKAFKRSWNVTKNYRFRIFLLFLITTLSSFLASTLVSLISGSLSLDTLYNLVFSSALLAPFQALWPAIATLLFFDLRQRKEAIDSKGETTTLSEPKN